MITSETKIFGILAGVMCLLALCALGGMLYFIEQKDTAYVEALEARAMRIGTEKEMESFDALVAETAHDREELAQYMLTEDSIVDFLSLIGGLAQAQGVAAETRSLAVEAIPDDAIFEYLTLQVEVTGSFTAVTEMLPLLESLPYQVHVRAVTVEHPGGTAEGDLWRGSYHLYVTKYK